MNAERKEPLEHLLTVEDVPKVEEVDELDHMEKEMPEDFVSCSK